MEYRIGNFVKSGTGIYSVACVSLEGIEATLDREGNLLTLGSVIYQPIQLDEEWLIKLGFSLNKMPFTGLDGYSISDGKGLVSWFIGFNKRDEENWQFANPHFNIWIKYVHQLQNIYHALTGQELELKNPGK